MSGGGNNGNGKNRQQQLLSQKITLFMLLGFAMLETYRTFVQVDITTTAMGGGYYDDKQPMGTTRGLLVEDSSSSFDDKDLLSRPSGLSIAAATWEPQTLSSLTSRMKGRKRIRATTVPPKSAGPVIHEKLKKAMETNNPKRDIVFVHVGKAGGMTIKQNVAAQCWERYPDVELVLKDKVVSREQRTELRHHCLAHYGSNQKLANQTRHSVHINLEHIADPTILENATTFLINIRNPIDRIVSAYRYSHPANCPEGTKDRKARGCWLKDAGQFVNGSPAYHVYNDCFPNPAVEDFAQAVSWPMKLNKHFVNSKMSNAKKLECRKLARSLVAGEPNKGVDPHMQANYQFYASRTFQKFPTKELFAIRTEHEAEDMIQLDVAMGGSGAFEKLDAHVSHGSEHYAPSPLSEQATHKLCCVLRDEIQVYLQIFDKAVNMRPEDKAEAEDKLKEQCGLQNNIYWIDWRERCQEILDTPMDVL